MEEMERRIAPASLMREVGAIVDADRLKHKLYIKIYKKASSESAISVRRVWSEKSKEQESLFYLLPQISIAYPSFLSKVQAR